MTPSPESLVKLLDEIHATLNSDETVAPRNLQADVVTLLALSRWAVEAREALEREGRGALTNQALASFPKIQ